MLNKDYNITVYGGCYDSVQILKGFSAHEFAASFVAAKRSKTIRFFRSVTFRGLGTDENKRFHDNERFILTDWHARTRSNQTRFWTTL